MIHGKSYQSWAMFGCAIALCYSSFSVNAQEDDEVIEQIVVTGTRIKSGNLTSPAPVASVDAEYIQLSGQTILTEVLQETPALIGSVTGNLSGDAANISPGVHDGTAGLNLRNLGQERTLVLINNRRHIASRAGTSVVDVNTIPMSLVERVDVLTGGASAVYGADGVSGVVNFVLKDDFEGLEVNLQTNLPDDAGGENYLTSITAGSNFSQGRGNIAGSFEYFRQNRVMNTQRGLIPGLPESININPNDFLQGPNDDNPNVPDRIFVANQNIPLSAPGGVVYTGLFDFSFIPQYTGAGQVFDPGFVTFDGNAIGGDGLVDLNPVPASIVAKEDRINVNLLSHYNVSEGLTVYGEVKYVDSDIVREFGGAKSIDDSLTFAYDNPFIPSSIVLDPVVIDGVGTPLPVVLMGRDNFRIGDSRVFDRRELVRTVAGIRGDISDAIEFDVSYVYGQVDTEFMDPATRVEDRFFAAMDAVIDPATGEPVCRSNLDPTRRPVNLHDIDPDSAASLGLFRRDGAPTYSFFSSFDIDTFGDPDAPSTTFVPGQNSGCVPLNLFGYDQSSPEAEAFVTMPTTNEAKLTHHVVTAVVSGDTTGFFELPAGPAGFALGAEYREEESSFAPDALFQRGAAFDPPLPATSGQFDVWEVFGEILMPVASGLPLVEDLSVGGAVRYSDYSTVGSTLTWRANSIWAFSEDISLRGSYSQAIRAPNVNELFEPRANAFFEPAENDPCLPANLGLGSPTRVANCTAALAAVGLDIADFVVPPTGPFLGTAGGNPELAEETSNSYTVGLILTPRFIDGLSLSVDYWDIEIEDAIVETDILNTINACYDAPTLDNPFCDSLVRSPLTGNIIDGATRTENIAFFESSGIDYELNYVFDLADLFASDAEFGSMRTRLVGSRLSSLSVVPVIDGVPDDEVGEFATLLGGGAPKYVNNFDLTWAFDRLSVNYQYRHQSGLLWIEKSELAADPDTLSPAKTRTFRNHDISMSFQVNDNLMLTAGVNNLLKPSREIGLIRRDRVLFLGATFAADQFPSIRSIF